MYSTTYIDNEKVCKNYIFFTSLFFYSLLALIIHYHLYLLPIASRRYIFGYLIMEYLCDPQNKTMCIHVTSQQQQFSWKQ